MCMNSLAKKKSCKYDTKLAAVRMISVTRTPLEIMLKRVEYKCKEKKAPERRRCECCGLARNGRVFSGTAKAARMTPM